MHTKIRLEVWLGENELIAHTRWYFLQFFVCPFKGHTQIYSDFSWCNRCQKQNVFQVEGSE